MKARAILLGLAMCFGGVAPCFAADAFTGTWKLNEAKSKLGPGLPKNAVDRPVRPRDPAGGAAFDWPRGGDQGRTSGAGDQLRPSGLYRGSVRLRFLPGQ